MEKLPDTPINWLWKELENHLDADQLAELHKQFNERSKRYNNVATIRAVKREIKVFEHNQRVYGEGSPQWKRYAEKLERRYARLKKLESESNESTDS